MRNPLGAWLEYKRLLAKEAYIQKQRQIYADLEADGWINIDTRPIVVGPGKYYSTRICVALPGWAINGTASPQNLMAGDTITIRDATEMQLGA